MKKHTKLFLIAAVLLLLLEMIPFTAMPTYAAAKEDSVTIRLECDETAISQNLLGIKVYAAGERIYGFSGKWVYSEHLTLQLEQSNNDWTLEQNGNVFCAYGTSPLEGETEVMQLTFLADAAAVSGEAVSVKLKNIQVSNGEKDIAVEAVEWNGTIGDTTTGGGGDTASGGCYVATAVYGSYDCPQVWTLRRYRDDTLAKTWYGRAFIHTYYAISPTLVKWFGQADWFKNMWRKPLDRMVERLNDEGVANTPYQDLVW